MKPEPHNDNSKRAAIIGGGLGGLSAAIHLQLAGYQVTIYEARDRLGGRANVIERDGFRFDTGPSLLNYPWVFEQLFRAAGRTMSDYITLTPVDPSIRFLWPDHTVFHLSGHVEKLREECERLEPDSAPGLMRFLADAEIKYAFAFNKLVRQNKDNPVAWIGALSPREFLQSAIWRSLYGELGRFFRNARIREALGSYAMYLGGSPWSLPGLFSILPYGELAYGLWLPKGGMYALIEGIEQLATELGVQIRKQQPVRRIRTRANRVEALEFADGRTESWPIVVSNVDVPTTQSKLLDVPRKNRMAMTPGVLTFYWGLRGTLGTLRHHTIFLPDNFKDTFDDLLHRNRIPNHLPFYISVPTDTDPSLAPPGHTAAFVLAPTPCLSQLGAIDWDETVAMVRQRVLDRLGQHGISVSPDQFVLEEVWTPETWGRAFGLYDGSAFGASHNLFQLGPFRARNKNRRIEGLYYVGASTTPGTGLPMVTLGGEMTARRILEHAH